MQNVLIEAELKRLGWIRKTLKKVNFSKVESLYTNFRTLLMKHLVGFYL